MVAAGNMYLDTGILVKLLTPEPETAFFERALRGHSLATSELALVEVKSALFAKERARLLTRDQRLRAEAISPQNSKFIPIRSANAAVIDFDCQGSAVLCRRLFHDGE